MVDKTASIMDQTLDDLPDLPGFKVPPTGAYAVEVQSILEKKIGDHPGLEVKFKIIEVTEVSGTLDEGEAAPQVGDECNVVYMLDNDTGIGFLKDFLRPLGEALGTKNNREIAERAKGMLLVIVVKRTFDEKKDRHYLNIKKLTVA
jgi:hypothetical protein